MTRTAVVWAVAALVMAVAAPRASAAPMLGQMDTFQDGTTQGWAVSLLGAPHPAPPSNVGGGQGGAADRYLLLQSVGGQGAGSKLSGANLDSRWTGDYTAAGVTAIRMDAINLGQTDLYLRFGFEDPIPGPPANIAFSDAIYLPAGSGWQTLRFHVRPGDLTAAIGSVATALANTTVVRLYHSPAPNFPNPVFQVPSIAAQLGVDNIAPVPEPATLGLLGLVLGGAAARRRRARH